MVSLVCSPSGSFFHFLFITENLEIRLSCFVFNFVDHQHAQVQENPQGSKGDNEIALSNISLSLFLSY